MSHNCNVPMLLVNEGIPLPPKQNKKMTPLFRYSGTFITDQILQIFLIQVNYKSVEWNGTVQTWLLKVDIWWIYLSLIYQSQEMQSSGRGGGNWQFYDFWLFNKKKQNYNNSFSQPWPQSFFLGICTVKQSLGGVFIWWPKMERSIPVILDSIASVWFHKIILSKE